MELLVKPEILTSYIYKLSCGTVVCKNFDSYQGYPNYRWDLIRYAKGSGGSASVRSTPRFPERPGTHCIGSWVGLSAGLDG
jgi:hypothetical protein